MTLEDSKHLHPDDLKVWLHVESAVYTLMHRAGLRRRLLVRPTERRRVVRSPSGCLYGVCETFSDRSIDIRLTLRFCEPSGEWRPCRVPFHQLYDTVCHEGAHALTPPRVKHGPRFFLTFSKLLKLADQTGLRRAILASGGEFPE